MAINRAEGFFHFNDFNDWAAKGHNGGGVSSAILPTGGRGGRGAVLVGLNNYLYTVMTSRKATVYAHFAFYTTARVSGQGICAFRNTANTHVQILGFEDGSIGIYRATPPFNSSGGFLTPGLELLDLSDPNKFRAGVWHHLQIKCTISASVGEVWIYVDGVEVTHLENVNTYGDAGTVDIVQLGFGNGLGAANHLYSDLVIIDEDAVDDDGNATDYVTFMGDMSVYEYVNPTDGDILDWTRSSGAGTWSSHVNQNPQDGDTTYLSSNTTAQEVTFFFPNIDTAIGTVLAYKEIVCHRKEEPSFAAIKLLALTDDDVEHFSETIPVTETYKFDETIHERDPKDGSALSNAKINATQLGIYNVVGA